VSQFHHHSQVDELVIWHWMLLSFSQNLWIFRSQRPQLLIWMIHFTNANIMFNLDWIVTPSLASIYSCRASVRRRIRVSPNRFGVLEVDRSRSWPFVVCFRAAAWSNGFLWCARSPITANKKLFLARLSKLLTDWTQFPSN
jgi:hypothetical protein